MAKLLAKPRIGNHIPRHAIGLQRRDARAQELDGGGLRVPYLTDVRTKETIMKLTVVAPRAAFAFDGDQWVSYSHWGMFPVRRDSQDSHGEE